MKNLLLGIIAISFAFISLDTNAFEFKGIKSGMTVEEINALGLPLSVHMHGVYLIEELDTIILPPRLIINAQGERTTDTTSAEADMDTFSLGQWIPNSELKRMYFNFDHNGKLYNLRVTFSPSVIDTAAIAGERLAIEELCPFEYFEGTSVFGCAFQDEGLYKDSVEHYKQMKLEILK